MEDLLKIRNLKVEFSSKQKTFQVLKGINLEVKKGEFVALVGESGSGKSMTALSIMNLLPESAKTTAGTIDFSGKNKSIIFQEPMTSLNPLIKIKKQIEESALVAGTEHSMAEKKARELAKMTGLLDTDRILNSYPYELSGGMRQRVMIASALMTNPELLIADEPTTALDISTQNEILKIFCDLKQQFNTALLLITHDFSVVKKICERIYIMYKGQIVEQGSIEKIFSSPEHPYTQALLNSIPNAKNRNKKLPLYFEQEIIN